MKPIMIKYCRQLSGLTQQQLAEMIGVDRSLISKIEAGTASMQPTTEIRMMKVFENAGIDTQLIYMINNIIQKQQ